jgi:hypothetical protein
MRGRGGRGHRRRVEEGVGIEGAFGCVGFLGVSWSVECGVCGVRC